MQRSRYLGKTLNPLTLTSFVTLLVLIIYFRGFEFLELVELKAYDLRVRARGVREPTGHVVLAVIDEKSLKELGKWPWPRTQIARLIRYLSEEGAAAIGFDIGFLEPDEHSGLNLINEVQWELKRLQLADERLTGFLETKKGAMDNDLHLAKEIQNSQSPVILGFFFHMSGETLQYTPSVEEMEGHLRSVQNGTYPIVLFGGQEPKRDPFLRAYMPQPNIPELTRVVDGQGYFNMIADKDGLVRWMPLAIKCGDGIYMPLSLQTLRHALGGPPVRLLVEEYGVKGVVLDKLFIPTNENGQLLINYLGPERTFRHYSISDILKGKIEKGEFKEKIVLVGATAIGIYDMRNTPFSPVYPGLEIHATLVDNIITGQFLSRPKWGMLLDFGVIVILSALIGVFVPRVGAIKALIFSSMAILTSLAFNCWLFWQKGFWVNITYPMLDGISVYIVLTVYKYITEEREKKKIRSAFSYYVAPAVVNEMLKNPEKLRLGGDKKELTVLFSDIRGFTSISEKMDPEDLVRLLNEYLTAMTNIVFKHGGTLDKYMGDAVMAIYGAPLEQEDHALRACETALEMLEELERLNEKWKRQGRQRLSIGIGINTGDMMVGNMGSEQRFDYTVMGDAVNLGSRLEGANKTYMTNILISETTYEKVKDQFICLEVDSVRVKGKALPVKIFTILGRKGQVSDGRVKAKELFETSLEAYKGQDWDRAERGFKEVLELDPDLSLADVYLKRCHELRKSPPGIDWDGVFEMKTK
ncbi:MAG: CHASE2 domain-containing protein [Desulfatiglandales bacterium]